MQRRNIKGCGDGEKVDIRYIMMCTRGISKKRDECALTERQDDDFPREMFG